MASWAGVPAGFTSNADAATKAPTKNGSFYTAGTYNASLGHARDEKENQVERLGWMVMKSTPLTNECGKKLIVDYAVWGTWSYFDFSNVDDQKLSLYIQFYSILTNKYDSHWTHYADYQLGTYSGSVPSASDYGKGATATTVPWSNPSECYRGAHKPAYGITYVKDVYERAVAGEFSSYDDYADACAAAGGTLTTWYKTKNYKAYLPVWPYGVRYISNNGKWAPGKTNVDGSGVIKGDYYKADNINWNRSNEDGGNTKNNYKTITINEDFIKRAHGTVTGVTAFRLKWQWYGDHWYFPENPIPNNWVMIDNPRIGLLDYGPAGSPALWPPRYDAKVWFKQGLANKVELQGKYNPGGSASDWQVF